MIKFGLPAGPAAVLCAFPALTFLGKRSCIMQGLKHATELVVLRGSLLARSALARPWLDARRRERRRRQKV
jgi:hypothetical protein